MDKIHASLVIEILGRPAKHVSEAMDTIITRMGSEKGIEILTKEIHEPAPVEKSKDLFTTFAEIEVELDSLSNYFGILFAYMPSHIEIIRPEKYNIMNSELNDLGNNLVQRLHNYDAVTKKALSDVQILTQKLQEVAPHLFKQEETQTPQKETKKKEKPKKKSKKKSK